MVTASKLGILAGGGIAPKEVMAVCRAENRPYFVFGLTGQVDEDLPIDMRLDFGAFGALKKRCLSEEIEQIVMIGHVRRPALSEIKPDLLGMKILAKIGLNLHGDDGVLCAVADAIEMEIGVEVIGAHEVSLQLLMSEGVQTRTQPKPQDRKDIERALDVARGLGALDVGQAVIVQHGLVLGVEAVEGTDSLIKRCGELKRGVDGGVLVKCCKPQQDRRFDLPTLGLTTIENLAKAGLAGVAMEAGVSLFLQREDIIRIADEKGLFVIGV